MAFKNLMCIINLERYTPEATMGVIYLLNAIFSVQNPIGM